MTAPSPAAPHGTMDLSEMKNQLSIAHIGLIVANAGIEIWESKTDLNGVDMLLRGYADYGSQVTQAQLDVQLKCTASAQYQHQDFISYPLDRHVYEKLANKRVSLGALAVLVIPGKPADWLHQNEERLLAKSCMYYSVAADWEPMEDGALSRNVQCMRSDILTVDALLQLMQRSANMEAALLS